MQTLPKLADPGAGISLLERIFLHTAVRAIYIPNRNAQGAIKELERTALGLTGQIKEIDTHLLLNRVLVSKKPFIEDSSRYWSVSMLFRHLSIVNNAFCLPLEKGLSLPREKLPSSEKRVAGVKPEIEKNEQIRIEEFLASVNKLIRLAESKTEAELKTAEVYHPWLGRLSHLQWLWFFSFHHRVHSSQLKAIVRVLRRQNLLEVHP